MTSHTAPINAATERADSRPATGAYAGNRQGGRMAVRGGNVVEKGCTG